jgi:hypothetical protein
VGAPASARPPTARAARMRSRAIFDLVSQHRAPAHDEGRARDRGGEGVHRTPTTSGGRGNAMTGVWYPNSEKVRRENALSYGAERQAIPCALFFVMRPISLISSR